MKNKKHFKCKSEEQKRAIRRSYAERQEKERLLKSENDFKLYSRDERHFRGHKDFVKGEIKYHPNYVFGETNKKYYSYGITEEKKYDKKHNNYPLTSNPNTSKFNKDKYKNFYIHKKARSDFKDNYTVIYNNYEFNSVDKEYIDNKIDEKYKNRD